MKVYRNPPIKDVIILGDHYYMEGGHTQFLCFELDESFSSWEDDVALAGNQLASNWTAASAALSASTQESTWSWS